MNEFNLARNITEDWRNVANIRAARIIELEDEKSKLQLLLPTLEEALTELMRWEQRASNYMLEKHEYSNTVTRIRAIIKTARETIK